MKTSKRFLATIVAVMLVITSLTMPGFAAFTDLSEDANSYTAVSVLNMLGVINGYDDGTFKPDNNVTRAEFTAMLLRTRGMGSVGSTSLENPPFPDVTTSDVSWAIGNIRTARELGIINGYDDGTFKPNANVLYEEAVKMIVCALGYGDMGSEGAFWYSKYLMTATSLGFTESSGGAISAPATRATIATMLYNCLEIKLAENNEITEKTILENDLKLTKNVGYIDSNPILSLSAPESNLRDNEIQIAAPDATGTYVTSTFKVENAAKYNDMIGAQITFYYTTDRESGFNTVISATVKDTEILELTSNQISDNTAQSIEYYKDAEAQRSNSVGIASDSVVVYNGKLFGTNKATSTFAAYCAAKGADAMPSIGKVKLLDRDGDKKYDVIFIDSYEAWIVSAATSSNYTITDNVLRANSSTKQLVLPKSNDVKILDANGNALQFSAIKKDNVLSVKSDSHGGITVVVTSDAVSGKITGVSSKKGYTINGKDYKSSRQAPWGADAVPGGSTLTAPENGDSGKYFLDIDGNILAYDKTESIVTQHYGYITNAAIRSQDGFDETLRVSIATKSSPSGKVYYITDKTEIDGTRYSNLSDALSTGLGGNIEQAIKFTLANDNEIDELITAIPQTEGTDIESDKLYVYQTSSIDKNTEWSYKSSTKELEYFDSATNITHNIYIGNTQILSKVNGKYQNMSLNNFSTSSGSKYTIEAFDLTKTNAAKFIVVHTSTAGVTTSVIEYPVVVITDIMDTTETADNSRRRVITGYVGNEEKRFELSVNDTNTVAVAPTLIVGDVVRLGKDIDDDRFYTVKADHVIFSTATGYRNTAILQPEGTVASSAYPKKEKNNEGTVRYQVIWGSAYKYDGESGTRFIVSNDVLTGNEPADYAYSTTPLEKSYFSNATFFEYDSSKDKDKFTKMTDEYLDILGNLSLAGDPSTKPSEIFIYMPRTSTVTSVIIVK